MRGLLNDVITGRHNDLARSMFINNDLSKLSVNGMSGFSVEREGRKRSDHSFTIHTFVFN